MITPESSEDNKSIYVVPDLDFIRAVSRQGGEDFKKCIQCGTCSATCTISPDTDPFPRKELIWANWGMKDRLLKDPDVWLCYQCNDCSTRCPRGARPGDVLAAVRQESVIHYAVPRFLARWASQPQSVLLLLGIPAGLLAAALYLRTPLENLLGISRNVDDRIVYAYSNAFPHWLLNSFFGFFSILVLIAVITGVVRFWRAMKEADRWYERATPANGIVPSIVAALKSIITHDKFDDCEKSHTRYFSHLAVFFGFLALCLVTTWVITARYNPLIQGDFVYPFSFWNPWKILANAGGIALVAGCSLMIFDRLAKSEEAGAGTFFDWSLIATLLIVVITGFATEVLHYVRLEPHRHIAYFIHLVFILALLLYLPYSKFAHIAYRTTAMVYAEYSGRTNGARAILAGDSHDTEDKEKDHAGEGGH